MARRQAMATARDGVINPVAQRPRNQDQPKQSRPKAAQSPRDAQGGRRTPKDSPSLDQDHRPLWRFHKTCLLKQLLRGRRDERCESKVSGRIAIDDEVHGAVAERAIAVEQDDTGRNSGCLGRHGARSGRLRRNEASRSAFCNALRPIVSVAGPGVDRASKCRFQPASSDDAASAGRQLPAAPAKPARAPDQADNPRSTRRHPPRQRSRTPAPAGWPAGEQC